MPDNKVESAKPMDAQPIPSRDPAKSAADKRKVAGHRVSIIGKAKHTIGSSRLRKGEHYSMDSLKLGKDGVAELRKDPYVVVEPMNAEGEVIAPKPGEDLEDEDNE